MKIHIERSTTAPRALALGGAALATFALLGATLASSGVSRLDVGVQRLALAAQSPGVHAIALGVTIAGGVTAMRILAVGAGAWLWRRTGWRAAALVVAMPLVAEALADVGKRAYARPRPAGLGQGVDATWAFPSAHAAVSAATCAMIAWLAWREGIITREAAIVFALGVPMLVGASRVLLNVHWASDVLGGWCEGLAIASLSIALRQSVAGA